MNRSYTLLGILHSYTSNEQQSAIVNEMYDEMRISGMSARDIELNLARTLHDGLEHGNWPWMVHDLTTKPTPSIKDDLGFDPATAAPTGIIPDVDATLRKYAEKLMYVHVNASPTDRTFLRLLTHFLLEVQGLMIRE